MGVSPPAPLVIDNDNAERPAARRVQDSFRGGRLRVAPRTWNIATWNVERLTDAKLIQLQSIMYKRGIGVLCMQETHKNLSEYYETEEGYLVILSGASGTDRDWVGWRGLLDRSTSSPISHWIQASVIPNSYVQDSSTGRENRNFQCVCAT